MSGLAEMITALSALLVALPVLLPSLRKIRVKRRHRQTIEGLRRLQRIHESLERIRELGADRAIVFAGHNSGGIPRPGSPYYTSALYWSAPEDSASVIPAYKKIPVDSYYIGMLIEAESKGPFHFSTEVSPQCQLRSYYEFEGVSDAWIYFLGIVEHNFLYLSVSKKGGAFSENELVPIGLEVANIQNNI